MLVRDQFEAIFGTKRGAKRPPLCGLALTVYAALTRDNLDRCLQLGMLPEEAAIIASAKVEREALDQLKLSVYNLLAEQAETLAATAASDDNRLAWAELALRLRDCERAREGRDSALLAEAHARKLGMLSVEGDIAMSRLLDSLWGLGVHEATETMKRGIRRLSAIYPGTSDTEVREGVANELRRMGVRLEPTPLW